MEAEADERGSTHNTARVAVIRDRLAKNKATHSPPPKQAVAYVWDENSPYVRVPKDIMSRVHFAPFATRSNRDGIPGDKTI